jgi:hypothetical protein
MSVRWRPWSFLAAVAINDELRQLEQAGRVAREQFQLGRRLLEERRVLDS